MNDIENFYFDSLTKDRTDSANTLEKPSMRGIKNSVVEKYSDQAHFIYELLQNADDAHATSARFLLESDRLIFGHNGTRLFSITNPATEDEDTENGKLGDINAITSIANSNKTAASIGKFGVGFKAVFQYTSTPYIYDPNFKFKIERFIVPRLINDDYSSRKSNETLFVFPFDHPERDVKEAYNDISDKLKNLTFPLLFLSDLKGIEFHIGGTFGSYGKKIKKTYRFDDITAELVCLTQYNGHNPCEEKIWLFSRIDESNHRYSVGFFTDKDGHLKPVDEPAFCFFPTKEVTGLNFIIHAPFLLTDSREGIRAGVPYNDKMIEMISDLAGKAIVYLVKIGNQEGYRIIDDKIINIIPYDPNKFSDPNNKRKVSFLPFYNSIKTVFEKEPVLPTIDGHISSKDAYWASVTQLTQLFSNNQLASICDNDSANWVFPSIGRDEIQNANRPLFEYIESIVKTNLNDDSIISGRTKSSFFNRFLMKMQDIAPIKGITGSFIESQPFEWLHQFYHWISDSKLRTKAIMKKPVFLDQDGKAVAAFDKEGQLILFLPVENVTDYKVVHPSLLEKQETRTFINEIGIKQPSLRDQIYNIILPQYNDRKPIDTKPHFKMFFDYYCSCANEEVDDYIKLICNYKFIKYYNKKDSKIYRDAANTMYLPTSDLERFFEHNENIRFIMIDEYKELVGKDKEKQLISFLVKLGIHIEPKIIQRNLEDHFNKISESDIEGLIDYISYVEKEQDVESSLFLWGWLCKLIKRRILTQDILLKTHSKRKDGRYRWNTETVDSNTSSALRTKKWMIDINGVFDAPHNLSSSKISYDYSLELEGADSLTRILDIQDDPVDKDEVDDDANLTDSQREKIELANKLMAMGFEESDFLELQRIKKQRETRLEALAQNENKSFDDDSKVNNSDDEFSKIAIFDDEIVVEEDNITSKDAQKLKLSKQTSRVLRDIARRTKPVPSSSITESIDSNEDIDQDEYLPSPVNYSKQIEHAKQRSAAEIDRIVYFEELQNQALTMQKYSFGWFKALLEMESINSGEANSNSKEISISFAKVEQEPGTKRTLVLKYPNRYIPQFMEDLADIPLVLHFGDYKRTVAIEVANIKSYTLRVKLKKGTDIESLDLSSVTAATIDAKSPAFLIEELRKEFIALEYDDNFNMQDNLCENIEFVFGPPGTGKTTYLAKNILMPLMQEKEKCRVLVITPTNKAADVLVRRIMEISDCNHDYENWLVRFGATGDEEIEQSKVFRDKTFDIRELSKNVTITTIARFPYDFFMPQGVRVFLNGINWDYIVFDEASMIPIANIVYPLYKKTPKKFIVAGDPFQIEPITSVDLWHNENIYTLVDLKSFKNPMTVPHHYRVKLLTTQYRSIPEIGNVFSKFAYNGILKHYRTSNDQKKLNIDNKIKTLNIIKFPVSKYESIYRTKRLQHSSSYQIYSALFTYEYISFLSREIAKMNPGELFSIGVIAPYRAQADLIDKLVGTEKMPDGVEVQIGTIHGFQGDECDIIFSIFNTPPTISDSNEMFLNKRNIINVSISRARDYLFIIMPDDNTEKIENLRMVKRVEKLIKDSNDWTEVLSPDLEKLIFGDSKYIENNTFSTSHQSVNVYGLPEKYYEVRTEDNAVDVQIHHGAKTDALIEKKEVEDINAKRAIEFEDDNNVEIPENLHDMAIKVSVVGKRAGNFYLIPYEGRLKNYTDKITNAMFIPLMREGKEKLVPVSVALEDKLIFIPIDVFKAYEEGLTNSNEIELKKNYYN